MNQLRHRCAATLLAFASVQAVAGAADLEAAAGGSLQLSYDIQVAWLDAGEIAMRLSGDGERYALSGSVATSRLMDRFFKWRGRFVATGRMAFGFPRTDAYMLWGDDGKEQETLLSFGGTTTIVRSHGESERLDQPPGSDFMSVTFLGPHCLDETTLHDGEDLYRLFLERRAAAVELAHRRPYYAGVADRCDYRFKYTDGRTRRLSLWVAHWQGRRVPVRIRVRFPLLPDGHLFLRTEPRDVANPELRRSLSVGR